MDKHRRVLIQWKTRELVGQIVSLGVGDTLTIPTYTIGEEKGTMYPNQITVEIVQID